MANVSVIFSEEELQVEIDEGYVSVGEHSTEPYIILNYTPKAAYSRRWNDVTLNCRGLILHKDTFEIVARPFPKFFNYGEPEAPTPALDVQVRVTDKIDGSMGILYPLTAGGWAIATRGSFNSEQAQHATKVWNEKYAQAYEIYCGEDWAEKTLVFEIVYPENRIVVDYRAMDDLVLLGFVNNETGKAESAGAAISYYAYDGPRVKEFDCLLFKSALAMSPRPNAEGLVVHMIMSGQKLKIKQEDYVRLHKIVTGLTARSVWSHMLTGAPLAELIEPLPDEFHGWVREVYASLADEVDETTAHVLRTYDKIMDSLLASPQEITKKDFAMIAQKYDVSGYLFSVWDGKDIKSAILKKMKPDAKWSPRNTTEEE